MITILKARASWLGIGSFLGLEKNKSWGCLPMPTLLLLNVIYPSTFDCLLWLARSSPGSQAENCLSHLLN